jgi:hypothetical protein
MRTIKFGLRETNVLTRTYRKVLELGADVTRCAKVRTDARNESISLKATF